MDPAQRVIITHKLHLLDEILQRCNVADFSPTKNGEAASDYLTNPNCEEPDDYVLKLADLLNLVGEQLLDSLVLLRSGFETAAALVEDGTLQP